MSVTQQFGPIQGPWQLENACIGTVNKWLGSYLTEVERQNGIPAGDIPRPSATYGTTDLEDFDGERFPSVLVMVGKPEGPPERFASAGYHARYPLTVAVVLMDDDPDLARQWAYLYAQALQGVVGQQFAGDNPGIIEDVFETVSPSAELPDPDLRTLYRGTVTFEVLVGVTVHDDTGPVTPVPDQETLPPEPTVATTNVTVVAVPVTKPVVPA
jgi:hypothetical protein